MAMDFGGAKNGKRGPRPEMNVTPLVDVVLVLLIIFMVITPLLSKQFWISLPQQREADAREPEAENQADEDEGPIVISVDAHDVIRINHEVVSAAELPRKLRRVLAARGERTVFFDASDDATYERAVEVLDIARGGGAATIAVLTKALSR